MMTKGQIARRQIEARRQSIERQVADMAKTERCIEVASMMGVPPEMIARTWVEDRYRNS